MTAIYFVGGQCSGKTTLVDYVAECYGLSKIPEIARTVKDEMGLSFHEIRVSPHVAGRYQREVFRRQLKTEREMKGSFVSDRAFDNLAYAAEHTLELNSILQTDDAGEYVSHVKNGIVFFARPQESYLAHANDGVRIDVEWESICRIDGMVKLMLEMWGFDYIPLSMESMQERARLVHYILGRVSGLRRVR